MLKVAKAMLALDFKSAPIRVLDYGLSVVCIGIGLWLSSPFWFWAGIVCLVAAILNPVGHIQAYLRRRFVRPAAQTAKTPTNRHERRAETARGKKGLQS